MRCLSHCAVLYTGGVGERVCNYTQLVGAGLVLTRWRCILWTLLWSLFMCRSKTHLLLCFALPSCEGGILQNVKTRCARWAQIYKMLYVCVSVGVC